MTLLWAASSSSNWQSPLLRVIWRSLTPLLIICLASRRSLWPLLDFRWSLPLLLVSCHEGVTLIRKCQPLEGLRLHHWPPGQKWRYSPQNTSVTTSGHLWRGPSDAAAHLRASLLNCLVFNPGPQTDPQKHPPAQLCIWVKLLSEYLQN